MIGTYRKSGYRFRNLESCLALWPLSCKLTDLRISHGGSQIKLIWTSALEKVKTERQLTKAAAVCDQRVLVSTTWIEFWGVKRLGGLQVTEFFQNGGFRNAIFSTRGNDFCFFAAIKTVRILKHTSSIIVRTITATLFFNVHKCGVLLIPLCPRCFVSQKLK